MASLHGPWLIYTRILARSDVYKANNHCLAVNSVTYAFRGMKEDICKKHTLVRKFEQSLSRSMHAGCVCFKNLRHIGMHSTIFPRLYTALE